VTDWDVVCNELLLVTETAEEAIEQAALEFIRAHARVTTDPAEVLRIAWHVYSYLFRDELLPVAGLEHVGPAELRMLREAGAFMALNKVRDNGSIANVGPCWFFPAAVGVVFDLDEDAGQQRNHAKFLAIDQRFLLVTSANFSWSAEYGNVELGVLIDNQNLTESVERAMRDLEDRLFERIPRREASR